MSFPTKLDETFTFFFFFSYLTEHLFVICVRQKGSKTLVLRQAYQPVQHFLAQWAPFPLPLPSVLRLSSSSCSNRRDKMFPERPHGPRTDNRGIDILRGPNFTRNKFPMHPNQEARLRVRPLTLRLCGRLEEGGATATSQQ